jgi:hypothetical protein
MVYRDQFIVAIRCNGQILREDIDTVNLPFGSNYEILLKNISTRKSQVQISIDGTDVLDGQKLVVFPNSSSELTGFLTNFNVTNKFKFIQKTNEISEFRGDHIDDGFIRIEYAFEKEIVTHTVLYETHVHHSPIHYIGSTFTSCNGLNNIGSTLTRSSYTLKGNDMVAMASCSLGSDSTLQNSCNYSSVIDQGITVKGEETLQRFNPTTIGTLESPKVIIIRLKGINDKGRVIEKPIVAHKKIQCEICGKMNESQFKCCSNCGTSLR